MSKPDLLGFAGEMAQMLWDAEGCDLDNLAVQELLVSRGIVRYRKPTANELADPEWWGHSYDIGPEDDGVGEFTPEMRHLRVEAAKFEAALREIAEEMRTAHDGGCVPVVKEILRRVGVLPCRLIEDTQTQTLRGNE